MFLYFCRSSFTVSCIGAKCENILKCENNILTSSFWFFCVRLCPSVACVFKLGSVGGMSEPVAECLPYMEMIFSCLFQRQPLSVGGYKTADYFISLSEHSSDLHRVRVLLFFFFIFRLCAV